MQTAEYTIVSKSLSLAVTNDKVYQVASEDMTIHVSACLSNLDCLSQIKTCHLCARNLSIDSSIIGIIVAEVLETFALARIT